MNYLSEHILNCSINNTIQLSFLFLGAGVLGELGSNKDLPISMCLRKNLQLATALGMSASLLKLTKNILY